MVPKLSICISTYNRGRFIGETLDSILHQMEDGVEIIVVDGASPDNTSEVMSGYLSRYPHIRYCREKENSGVDHDYDKAVGYASGEHCWLMTDDDLMKPGAIRRVLSALERKNDLIVVNSEIWNADLSERLLERRLDIPVDVEYGESDRDAFFTSTANQLGFIGCVIVRRSFWLSRDRSTYYGTLFIHVGVIFQNPPVTAASVIADPLIMIRNGNAMWSPRSFEIWMFKWPQLVWSFSNFSAVSKQAVCKQEPWDNFKQLFYHRAMGSYSLKEFRMYLHQKTKGFVFAKAYVAAVFPGVMANLIVVFYYLIFKRSSRLALFDVLQSRYATVVSRLLARTLKLNVSRAK